MTDKVEIIELTEEDCLNILTWWTAASMMVEGGMRIGFTDGERDTIAKVSKAEEKLRYA